MNISIVFQQTIMHPGYRQIKINTNFVCVWQICIIVNILLWKDNTDVDSFKKLPFWRNDLFSNANKNPYYIANL